MTDRPIAHPRGEAMVRELLTIHGHLRHDLQRVRELAQRLLTGMPAAEIRAGVAQLAIKSPVWALRLNCRRYCEFVHLHHGLEDRMLLPGLRRAYPEIRPALDKLEADHEEISLLLDDVDAAVAALMEDPSPIPALQLRCGVEDETRRVAAVQALDRLADRLLAHLEYEEASLSPVLRQMDEWPW